MQRRHRTRQAEEKYKALRREEKRTYRRKKREYMRKELEELQELSKTSEAKKFYQKLNKSKQEFKPRTIMCRDKRGNILTEGHEILKRWKEYFEEKLKKNENESTADIALDPTDDRGKEPPTLAETLRAIKKLKK